MIVRLVEALLARVLWDDASTPVPLLWLGAQDPWWAWDGSTDKRLLVTASRIKARLSTDPAAKGCPRRGTCPVFLDSGAFSWLSKHGTWDRWPAAEFAEFVAWVCDVLGTVEHAGIQDYMCEPHMLAKTGLTIEDHQRRTVASYLELRRLAPQVPWLPTLQGFAVADYLRCAEMYEHAGVRLDRQALVGLGSVCRRSSTTELEVVIRDLVRGLGSGIRLHGFGVKDEGAMASCLRLASMDSQAGSRRGRGIEDDIRLGLGLPLDAPWSAVLAADHDRLDLDLADWIPWRTHHAPGGLQNSQAFVEDWRLRQLAKLCARVVDGTVGHDEAEQIEIDLPDVDAEDPLDLEGVAGLARFRALANR